MTYAVVAGGLDISDKVTSIRLRFGFDLRISEAEIELSDLPTTIAYWDTLVVSAGCLSTGGDTAGLVERFNGYVYDFDAGHWPSVPKMTGRGPLIVAERLVCPDDLQTDHRADPLANPADYKDDAPGIDLSANPDTDADWTDADMVTWLLGQANLTGQIDPTNGIGGTGRLLGTIAPEAFTWRRGTSALAFVEELDRVCIGFRTFERLDGLIARTLTSPLTPFLDNRVTFLEGTDLLEGATVNRAGKDERNRCVVTGFDDGTGAETFVGVAAIPNLPPGIDLETDTVTSPLIEVSNAADVVGGAGLSCEEVAAWRLDEVTREYIEITFPTWRDDVLSPGDTVYVNAPHLLGTNQTLWLKTLELAVAGGESVSFTQTLTCRGAAARDRGGALTASLPLSLGG